MKRKSLDACKCLVCVIVALELGGATDSLDWYELGVVEPLDRINFTYCGK